MQNNNNENNNDDNILQAAKILGIEPELIDNQQAQNTIKKYTLNKKNTKHQKTPNNNPQTR